MDKLIELSPSSQRVFYRISATSKSIMDLGEREKKKNSSVYGLHTIIMIISFSVSVIHTQLLVS